MRDNILSAVLVIVLVMIVLIGFGGSLYQSWGYAKCYENGYPEFKWSLFNGKGYCIKRIDQTDTVTPIGDLK